MKQAGILTEPPVSDPIANAHKPAAVATPEPLDDPPGVRCEERSHGFQGVPLASFTPVATGVNEARGTPWNPWDLSSHRTPGGSSSGSGVATAAGLCAFAMGSDTGGSVRIPACFNGIFGHKTSIGLLPTDGVFPLSPTLDTLGPLTRTAADAAIIHAIMTDSDIPLAKPLKGLRLGKPTTFFFDDLFFLDDLFFFFDFFMFKKCISINYLLINIVSCNRC